MIADLAAVLTARHLGHAQPGSREWDLFRRDRLGGSEIAAIAGESKYESAYSLWAKRLDLIPSQIPDNEPMYWGRELEPVVINRFERDNPGYTIYRDVGTWVNKKHDFMLANPDALYLTDKGELQVLEIKTARFEDDWGRSGTGADGVPKYYLTQVQWYLATLGLQTATLAVLISGSDYRTYEVEADSMWQDYDFERAVEFLSCLETKTKPAWDGAEATLQAVRLQHPSIDLDAEVELGDLGMHYFLELDKLEEQKKLVTDLQARVLDAMGNARTGIVHDIPALIRTARNGGTPYLTKKKVKK